MDCITLRKYPLQSLPLRKCGLKYNIVILAVIFFCVTSLAEVWIEIATLNASLNLFLVTSLAEVWIEIISVRNLTLTLLSLPLRKCGLK